MLRQPFAYATLLAAAGLIPFIALAAVVLLDPLDSPAAIQALICYGAVILAFVGAVHWGFALREAAHPAAGGVLAPAALGAERQLLSLGIVPAIIGWIALLAMLHFALPALALFLLLAGFFVTIVTETIGRGRGVVAANYLAMRWGVSIIVLIALALVLFAVLTGMRTG